ncbi:hypothetical protein JCM15124A_11050 [Prevotella falsenii]
MLYALALVFLSRKWAAGAYHEWGIVVYHERYIIIYHEWGVIALSSWCAISLVSLYFGTVKTVVEQGLLP